MEASITGEILKDNSISFSLKPDLSAAVLCTCSLIILEYKHSQKCLMLWSKYSRIKNLKHNILLKHVCEEINEVHVGALVLWTCKTVTFVYCNKLGCVCFTVPVVKKTWFKDAGPLEFYSEKADKSIPTISLGVPNTERGVPSLGLIHVLRPATAI